VAKRDHSSHDTPLRGVSIAHDPPYTGPQDRNNSNFWRIH